MTESGRFQEPESPLIPTLRDTLVKVTFGPNRAIDSDVKEIALDALNDEALYVMRASFDDPNKRTVGRLIYVTQDERVLVQKKPLIINDGVNIFNFGICGNTSAVFKRDRQERFIGAVIRNYPLYPPMPADLRGLFLEDSNISAQTAVLIINSREKIVVFRGAHTPELTEGEIDQKVFQLWIPQLNERIKHHVKPEMAQVEKRDIVRRSTWAMLKQIAEKYDLRIFTGKLKDKTVKLMDSNAKEESESSAF